MADAEFSLADVEPQALTPNAQSVLPGMHHLPPAHPAAGIPVGFAPGDFDEGDLEAMGFLSGLGRVFGSIGRFFKKHKKPILDGIGTAVSVGTQFVPVPGVAQLGQVAGGAISGAAQGGRAAAMGALSGLTGAAMIPPSQQQPGMMMMPEEGMMELQQAPVIPGEIPVEQSPQAAIVHADPSQQTMPVPQGVERVGMPLAQVPVPQQQAGPAPVIQQ
ncbi:hypothetical protein HK102_010713 [Quaeritorhiza haematococci]|nr:hypothetical protein HK102_010713 [Quaeritorhiza haematococci]